MVAAAAMILLVAVAGIPLFTRDRLKPVSPVPTGPIDLSGWKLSIPERNDKGDATSIEPATTKAPWLTPAAGGALVFWAPTTGVTTRNSEHPRTELQSRTTFAAGTVRHTLAASVSLLQLPQDGRGVILGQIHGAADIKSVPYVMLRLQNDQLRVVVKQVLNGNSVLEYPLLEGIGINSRVDYTITDKGDGTMLFSATCEGVTRQATAPVPAAFRGAPVRFQAGDYQQANATGGAQDGGRVLFHGLVQQ